MKIFYKLRYSLKSFIFTKKIYLFLLRLLPVHMSYDLNRRLRSPYSSLESEKSIIFIHIPKAAGNALIKTLYGVSATGHDPLTRYKQHDKCQYDQSFKFAVVRNPWDRMVSSFHYLKQGGIGFFDADFSQQYLVDCDDFNVFLHKMMSDSAYESKIMTWVHFVPQLDFLSLDGESIDVDLCVKLEEMTEKMSEICFSLGIEPKNMIKDNASNRESYQSYYSTETASYVKELYQNDILLLGYKF